MVIRTDCQLYFVCKLLVLQFLLTDFAGRNTLVTILFG